MPTLILMLLWSSLDNLLKDAYIIFQKSVFTSSHMSQYKGQAHCLLQTSSKVTVLDLFTLLYLQIKWMIENIHYHDIGMFRSQEGRLTSISGLSDTDISLEYEVIPFSSSPTSKYADTVSPIQGCS